MNELRLLGPVELLGVNDERYDLGRPQQRCVLAALAMFPGRTMAAEKLIANAWRKEPAEGARDLLYSHVSRLRRVLRQDGADVAVLRRSNGGYVLDIDPQRVDLHRARALADQARAGLAQARGSVSDSVRAVELLRDAAAQWRGMPLAGLRGPWAEQMRAALQRELVGLLTERYDIEMRLGRHAHLVAALSAAVVEHPLVEPLTGQLMLALYRSGRQADSLQAYARIRKLLVQEIGEEPGPALRRLHEQILRQDPVLDPGTATREEAPTVDARSATDVVHVPGRPGTGRREHRKERGERHSGSGDVSRHPYPLPDGSRVIVRPTGLPGVRPAQLPPDVAGFIGRETYVDRLDGMVPGAAARPSGAAICTIVGTAGVGKTTLAVHWAHRAAEHFPDGQLYVDLHGFETRDRPAEPAEALRDLLLALRVPADQIPASVDARTGLLRSLLAGRRVLVVLDNARDADQVLPLLPGAPGCTTVITSRYQLLDLLAATGAEQIVLQPFSTDQATSLLQRRLGSDRLAGQEWAVTEIVQACARLPLPLAQVAAHLAARPGLPLSALAGGDLHPLGGGDLVADIRIVFSWSYRLLSPGAARLFRLIGLHPQPEISTGAAATLAGLIYPEARTLLSELTQASLLTESAPGHFTMHSLLHQYAGELARQHHGQRTPETVADDVTHR